MNDISTSPLTVTKQITVSELISRLNNIMLERQYAYKAYAKKYNYFDIKVAACEKILSKLAQASQCINDQQTVAVILTSERLFLEIAPRSTSKLYNTWKAKTDSLFDACRVFLGRRNQQ